MGTDREEIVGPQVRVAMRRTGIDTRGVDRQRAADCSGCCWSKNAAPANSVNRPRTFVNRWRTWTCGDKRRFAQASARSRQCATGRRQTSRQLSHSSMARGVSSLRAFVIAT
jgi:hypothetical protein